MVNTKRSLVGEIMLKNLYSIYVSGSQFVVVQKDKHGDLHEQNIPKKTVDTVANLLDGEQVSVAGAFEILEPMVDEGIIQLPFRYGYKLKFYIQNVLLVLVATGRAKHRKEGRGFLYQISVT